MRTFFCSLFVVFISMLAGAPAADAQKRVALVIGNSAYHYTPALMNPRNDAADMTVVLKGHGFEIIEGYDLDKPAFERTVRNFSAALKGAEAGVFFYAGHGLQAGGQNYLVPIDAKAESPDALEFEMVRVDIIHRIMERQTNTNILFLDACRDNPLARNLARSMGTRSTEISRGLAAIESGVGTLISFSTQPGNVALDGAGRNSPFARALIKHISSTSDDLSNILISVRNDVMSETQRKQVPWEHSALTGKFFFNSTSQPQPTKTPPARLSEAAEAWDRTRDLTDVAILEAFVAHYRETFFAELARARINELNKQSNAALTSLKATSKGTESAALDDEHRAGLQPAPHSGTQIGGLFTEADAKRVNALAEKHKLMLPDFQIETPDDDVPAELRRFIGIWVDETGGEARARKHMIIMTAVEKDGKVYGHFLSGPPTASSADKSSAGGFKFIGKITGNTMRFSDPGGTMQYRNSLTSTNHINYLWSNDKGQYAARVLNPVWSLVEMERSAKR
jgi:uncharacterized caspase-like protein